MNEVLTGLVERGLPADELPVLGFLPSGTANAATLAFGFEKDPARAAGQMTGKSYKDDADTENLGIALLITANRNRE